MNRSLPLRTGGLTEPELRDEARHLRLLARLNRGLRAETVQARRWDAWGVAEVVALDEVQPRALQLGETVLIAPHEPRDTLVVVHSKIRGADIRVPRRCLHVALPPEVPG